ncbi:MAG: sugar phosphate isomerase/epimerase [Planctomycetota bacterium]
MNETHYTRRETLKRLAGVAALSGSTLTALSTVARAEKPPKIPLGFDNFSIRAFGWKANRLIDHAASRGVDSLLLSDLFVFENYEEKTLKNIRDHARDKGIQLHVGTGGICPTSSRVLKKFGSPQDHLRLLLRVAKTVGSPVARCYLGGASDRKTPGGIDRHIDATVNVLRSVEKDAKDAGVKIAVENHAGDMQARELVRLIESAGKDYVGATIDSGNATWTLEDPVRNLEILGPYAVSSGIRDSMVWDEGDGIAVQWTAMGDGCVDLKRYVELFAKLCPGVPLQLEIISGITKQFPVLTSEFWGPYDKVLASDFAAFAALARKGKKLTTSRPKGKGEVTQKYQMAQLDRSIDYCKRVLGLGR